MDKCLVGLDTKKKKDCRKFFYIYKPLKILIMFKGKFQNCGSNQ